MFLIIFIFYILITFAVIIKIFIEKLIDIMKITKKYIQLTLADID